MDSKGKERSSKRPYSDQRDYDEMLLGSDHFLHEFLRNELHSTKSLEDQPALSLKHALHHYMNHLVSSLHQEQRPSLTSEIPDNNIPVQIGSTQNQHDLAKQLPRQHHDAHSIPILEQPHSDPAIDKQPILGTVRSQQSEDPLQNSTFPEDSEDDIDSEEDEDINPGKKWREFKTRLKKHNYDPYKTYQERIAHRDDHVAPNEWEYHIKYWSSEVGQERCAKNKTSRAKQTTTHTSGTKSFARVRAEGQINEISALYSDIAGKKASRDDLFARILGEDKRNTIRSYGLGVAATKVFGLDPTRAECLRMLSESENEREKERHEMQQQLDNMKQKYEDMQNEVAILKAQFEAISKRPEGVPTSRRKDVQHNEVLDTIPVVVNANVCPKEPSRNEVSSSQSSYEIPQNQDGSEVYLKSLKKPHNNVAQGTLLSKDPKTKVGGVELGPQCWEIQIDIPIIRVEPLLRSYKGYQTIGDAVGASVAWPFTFSIPVELHEDLSFEEHPVRILAREVKRLRNREIPYVKILWSNHEEREATWELENAMQEHYPIYSRWNHERVIGMLKVRKCIDLRNFSIFCLLYRYSHYLVPVQAGRFKSPFCTVVVAELALRCLRVSQSLGGRVRECFGRIFAALDQWGAGWKPEELLFIFVILKFRSRIETENIANEIVIIETCWTVDLACLPLCSFAHACEGSSLQAGTPELAYATVARPCGIGCRSGLPWGVYTTTGPLGAAQAGLP
uniref:Transposase Tnp1/En/Spm-like domain-containing protein n=1 Tax=Ananas comosus var. bracteatus TaxID=296719 RepID=A0A6V7QMB6_ANACO|nr:unnamed protein product [Ananas comosus var. bracteatus]